MGPGGFYHPSNRNGAKLRLHMMCFGRLWDPVTKYEKSYRSDGSAPPPLPYEFISLAENAIQDAQVHGLPSTLPDICVANLYSIYDRLGLHQVTFYWRIHTHAFKCFLAFLLAYLIWIPYKNRCTLT
ncbi:putative alkylated DNA repair protein AlkB [Helianthus annuus]|nr:putative alkylated DNA repair protein AlkB [Helianthus annuus]